MPAPHRLPRFLARTLWPLHLPALLLLVLQTHAADPVVSGFEERLIAGNYGYTFGVQAIDLDADGDLDLTNVDIVGKNPSDASLLWFENNGRGEFQRHVMHTGENGWLERHSLGDLNGDGRADVAVVSNRDGHLLWFEQPPQSPLDRWIRHEISRECPGAYDVRLGDLDGDGDLDAATAGYSSHTLSWYENPGQERVAESWPRHIVARNLAEHRTVEIVDFNGDGRPDLLAGSLGVSFAVQGPTATPEQHGGLLAWFENTGNRDQWTRHIIDDQHRGVIHAHTADLDRDGDFDIVLARGMRPEHIPAEFHELVWYENQGTAQRPGPWRRQVLVPLPSAFEAIAVDLDADGDLDVAATAWSLGDQVVWCENPGNPRQVWTKHVIRNQYFAANQLIAADLDGDQRPDLVVTSDDGSRRVQGANELRWWRNRLTPPQ
ncbi:MAG: FG-GAP repeat domain-containing protein [Planctomycetaceae bacterium]